MPGAPPRARSRMTRSDNKPEPQQPGKRRLPLEVLHAHRAEEARQLRRRVPSEGRRGRNALGRARRALAPRPALRATGARRPEAAEHDRPCHAASRGSSPMNRARSLPVRECHRSEPRGQRRVRERQHAPNSGRTRWAAKPLTTSIPWCVSKRLGLFRHAGRSSFPLRERNVSHLHLAICVH